jgi:hypothetical protein
VRRGRGCGLECAETLCGACVGGWRRQSSAWNVDWKELQCSVPIGEGSFGRVYLGRWRETTVAIKVLTVPSTQGVGSAVRRLLAFVPVCLSSEGGPSWACRAPGSAAAMLTGDCGDPARARAFRWPTGVAAGQRRARARLEQYVCLSVCACSSLGPWPGRAPGTACLPADRKAGRGLTCRASACGNCRAASQHSRRPTTRRRLWRNCRRRRPSWASCATPT